ncbi:nucleotide-binding universal stress UspA family protein [Rhodoligotrophos appendicifer]|uniref:universal stress protein n=1 Tax=Rhodoligotrophos appendicifer TaxID=987056 RepID=UPI001185BF20|nr:universal stress protein [Rhodoligotrophos appendicifer]
MKSLLALIDASLYAQSVCDHAAWASKQTGATIELVHVLGRREGQGVPADYSGNLTLDTKDALLSELAELDLQRAKLSQKRGRMILDEARARMTENGVTQITTKLRNGDLLDTVAELERDADLILIGKRGEAADFARLHLGSNLERVVRSSHKPVLVASRAFRPIKRFLIAYDGGATTMKAVDYIARSDLFAGLECHLLTVGSDTTDQRRKIEDAERLLKAGSYDVEAKIIPGQPEAIISQTIERDGIDLLVMGAYSHSRIRSLFIGSTTTEMVRSCKVPVLLVR